MLGGTATTAEAKSAPILPCTGTTHTQAQKTILNATNAQRKKVGLPALKLSDKISSVALAWSKKQAKAQKMSHNPKFTKEMPSGWHAAGENVAYGYHVEDVTPAWIDSRGHRENIERKQFTHIGIGIACAKNGSRYYTQNFGGYKKSPDPAKLTVGTPKIKGTAKVGKTLTATPGKWTAGTKFTYQWHANGKAISKATSAKYKITKAHKGKTITVRVVGKKPGYSAAGKTSAKTGKVK